MRRPFRVTPLSPSADARMLEPRSKPAGASCFRQTMPVSPHQARTLKHRPGWRFWSSRRSPSCRCSWSTRSCRRSRTRSTSGTVWRAASSSALPISTRCCSAPPWRRWCGTRSRTTFRRLIALMIIQNGGGFLLAWLLYKEPFGFRFHRVAVFVPVVLSTIIVGFLWKLFLNPNFGLVNQALIVARSRVLAQAVAGRSIDGARCADPRQCLALHRLSDAGLSRRHAAHSARDHRGCAARRHERVAAPQEHRLAAGCAEHHDPVHAAVHRRVQLVRDSLRDGGLDGSPFGNTDVLGLVFYRTAFGNQSAGIQNFGQGSALATLIFLVHRRFRVDADALAAPAGDPALNAGLDARARSRLRFWLQIILIANSFIMLYPVVVMVFSAFKRHGGNLRASLRGSRFHAGPELQPGARRDVDADLFHQLDRGHRRVDRV